MSAVDPTSATTVQKDAKIVIAEEPSRGTRRNESAGPHCFPRNFNKRVLRTKAASIQQSVRCLGRRRPSSDNGTAPRFDRSIRFPATTTENFKAGDEKEHN
jgi:hypothetical protein